MTKECTEFLKLKLMETTQLTGASTGQGRGPGHRQHYKYLVSQPFRRSETSTIARLAQRIWDFLMIHKITIVTYHLPGIENTLADRESRRPLNFLTDLPPLFARVDRHFGRHTIDAFASFQDRQLDRFGSSQGPSGWTLSNILG